MNPTNQLQNNTTPVTHEITLYAEPIAHIGSFPITNSLLTSWIAVLIIVVMITSLRLKLKEVPNGIQNLFEIILEGALSLCDQVTGTRKITTQVFPLAFSIFMFVLVNNWLGILPVSGFGFLQIGEHGTSF